MGAEQGRSGPAEIVTSGTPAAAGCPVVGIGASAGGIEALIRLFSTTPSDGGVAYLVVMHLDPSRDSGLAHILGQHTAMPVVEAADGMAIDADRVYVIAPDSSLTVENGRLRLTEPPERRGHRYPVDRLFASLALHRGERAICIVLSGTGSDGTEGLKEVKAHGGCVLVQDPATARFDMMPHSAIAADLADRILAPEQMADAILRYVRNAYVAGPADPDPTAADVASIDPVLALLRTRAGQDFRHYKAGTLLRRLRRRMSLNDAPALSDYIDLLRSSPTEIGLLAKDLMINVTGFFRDPEAWKVLDETVLTPLLAARDGRTPVRVWVPACATGEEAYSLAMLLVERADASKQRPDIRIFATDARDDNLDVARAGVYSEGAVAAIPADRLGRFFDRAEGGYRVKKEIRDRVVFAAHGLLRDPPFSRLDLVSCRNLLIYLDPAAQSRAVALLHFALREGGYLFLGNAETVGRRTDLFEPVSKKWRIYRRLGPTRHDVVNFPALPVLDRGKRFESPVPSLDGSAPRPAELARRALLDRFSPPSVLVDRNGHALWFHGDTGDYLAPPPGEPGQDIFAMARGGLRARLRDGMRHAATEKRPVTFGARVGQAGRERAVTVVIAPVAGSEGTDTLLLVSFMTPGSTPVAHGEGRQDDGAEQASDQELKTGRAELEDAIEQLNGLNDALKAANEEVTSMNEELQSANEELETSQEEMHSFNEELQTVNSQLQHKIKELEDASYLLDNLLISSEITTVFLDENLCIRWYSPASREVIDLVPSDIGRPVTNFAWKVDDDSLLRDAKAVLQNPGGVDAEVRGSNGHWYLRRLLPYRTHDDRVTGVVVSFVDITERKHAADLVNEARIYAEAIIETSRQPFLVLDSDLRVRSINGAFSGAFGCEKDKSVGYLLHELDHGAWDIPELRHLLNEVLTHDHPFEGLPAEHHFPRLGRRSMLMNARRLVRAADRPGLILLAIEDVTARVQAEEQQQVLAGELHHRLKNVLATVQSICSLTLRRSTSLEEFKSAFEGRLGVLGRAHDILINENWVGADMGDIARATLDPYRVGDRVSLDGPAIRFKPETGVAVAMVLHELATNAAKYGALSSESGRLQVSWRELGDAGDRQVRLTWVESGGPSVTPPARRGFGSRLIEQSIVRQLGGMAKSEFEPDGLRFLLAFPSDGNMAPASTDPSSGQAQQS